MSEKISRTIFLGEYIIIAVPLSLLLLVATIMQTVRTIALFNWYNIANTLSSLVACSAVIAGIRIGGGFVKPGSSEISNSKPISWIIAFLGALLPFAAWASMILPPSPEYSTQELFRDDFEFFILGFPMLIPFLHLCLERFLRKEKRVI